MKFTLGRNLGIICPACKQEVRIEIETSGLFGGIVKQMLIWKVLDDVLDQLKLRGGTVKCKCGHTFGINPEAPKQEKK